MSVWSTIATAGTNLYNSIAYNLRVTFKGYTPEEKAALEQIGKDAKAKEEQFYKANPGATNMDYLANLAKEYADKLAGQAASAAVPDYYKLILYGLGAILIIKLIRR